MAWYKHKPWIEIILVVTALLAFGLGNLIGISNLSNPILGTTIPTWLQLIAIGQAYIFIAFRLRWI